MAKPKIFDAQTVARITKGSFLEFYSFLDTGNFLVNIVKSFILSGQSPVAKIKRRFQKYSKSYLDFLDGKVRFVTMNGRVRPVFAYKTVKAKGKKGEYSPLGYNKKYDTLVSNKRGNFGKIDKFDKPFPNKKKSPVNLYATGEMMDSLNLTAQGARNYALIGFTDKKAKYHNDLGAGKSKVIRRLLPTGTGEKFIPNIDKSIKDLAKLSVKNTLEKNKSYLKVQFVLTGKR